MPVFNRRAFVKSFLFSPVLLYITSKSSIASTSTRNHFVHSNLNAELIRAYIAWEEKFTQKPIEYLGSKNLVNPLSTREIFYHSKNDFTSGNTLEIDGLVLSKTETAFILSLYFE